MSNETFFLEQTTSNSYVTFAINSSYISEDTENSYIVEAVNTLDISSAIEARKFCKFINYNDTGRLYCISCSDHRCADSYGCHNKQFSHCELQLFIRKSEQRLPRGSEELDYKYFLQH